MVKCDRQIQRHGSFDINNTGAYDRTLCRESILLMEVLNTMPGNDFPHVKIGVVGLGRFGRLHALTVAGIGADGALWLSDHVLDTRETRFAGTVAVDAVSVGASMSMTALAMKNARAWL